MVSKFTDTENNGDRAPNRKNLLVFFEELTPLG
jgi:hypothetical protein